MELNESHIGDEVLLIGEVDYEVWPGGDPDRAYLVNIQPGLTGTIVDRYLYNYGVTFDDERFEDEVIEVWAEDLKLLDNGNDEG